MLRVVLSQLRRTMGRTVALVLAIVVATTSFTLLTGAVQTSRLAVRGTVAATFRSSYDLLVRPAATASGSSAGLVRPNYQSGIFGGITEAQLDAVRGVEGVDVAAPVSNLGYVNLLGSVRIDLRPMLDADTAQLFRVRPVFTMDGGLSRLVGTPLYVYVSRRPAAVVKPARAGLAPDDVEEVYAERVPGRALAVSACANYLDDQLRLRRDRLGPDATYETDPWGYRDPSAYSASTMRCYYLPTRGREDRAYGAGDPAQLEAVVPVSLPVLLAAVDPDAEEAVSGLRRAVVDGRTLSSVTDGAPAETDDASGVDTRLPVLASTSISLDQEVSASVERVDLSRTRLLGALAERRGLVDRLDGLPATRLSSVAPVPAQTTWDQVSRGKTSVEQGLRVGTYWQVGPSGYRDEAGALRVDAVPNPESAYVSPQLGDPAPVGSDDSGVRRVTGVSYLQGGVRTGVLDVVGHFDPAEVLADAPLSGLVSPTYSSPLLPGADAASRTALAGGALAPSSNVAGYAAQPPALLTTLPAARLLLNTDSYGDPSVGASLGPGTGTVRPDPISVIRVRVAGVTGPDPVSRERLDQAALAIGRRTGLAVDIVAGSSGVPTTVVLPAGDHGRPELRLTEVWARTGLAYEVVSAVDRKSLTLFLLVLVVCALAVGNAASAAVRTRRVGLGVLSCLGWRAGRLFALVLAELAVVGVVAGLLGAALALGIGAVAGLPVSPARALLAAPPAVLLALLAGLVPAVGAARAAPMDAVRPSVRSPRRTGSTRSVARLAVRNLGRTPGRTALGAASLAVGVGALTVLLSVQLAFRGLVVGSLLGDAVALQVRGPDVLALGATMLLGAAAVADVLYLSVREQAGELALLRATGWRDSALVVLVAVQGLGIGVLGSVAGVLAGALAVLGLTGTVPAGLAFPLGAGLVVGVVLAVVAALVPALLLRRLPILPMLAEEGA